MLHEGKAGAVVALDSLLPNHELYAVGALADLSGEVTIVGGRVYLSYPDGSEDVRTETTTKTNAGAALLVTSMVAAWDSVRITEPISFEDLDEKIGKLAASAGIDVDERFPFLLSGELEDLQWHVIDGRKIASGESSHEDHHAAAIHLKLGRTRATLVGFYSDKDQGVFTHMGSRTHIHCALDEPLSTGHVGHVTIPVGATLMIPTAHAGGRTGGRPLVERWQ